MDNNRALWLVALFIPLAGCSQTSPTAPDHSAVEVATPASATDAANSAAPEPGRAALNNAMPDEVAEDEAPADKAMADRPKIYDAEADGFAQIETALKEAQADNKRVLLQFGAEWCGWCHKLHRLFGENSDIAAELAAHYVVVLIDIDGDYNQAVNEKYGNPQQHGLPVVVVLDSAGEQLTTQNTGDLEEGDHHDVAKVMAFLTKWADGSGSATQGEVAQN